MFCTLRNFSPPCAVNAAFASSIGLLSGVITTAGGAAEVVAGVDVLPPFPAGCSWAAAATPQAQRQAESARDFKNKLFIFQTLSIRSSIEFVRRFVDYRRRCCRRPDHQNLQTRLPIPTTHQNSATQDSQPAGQDLHDSGDFES